MAAPIMIKVFENKIPPEELLKNRVLFLSKQKLITKTQETKILSKRGSKNMEREIFRLLMRGEMENSIRVLEVLKGEIPSGMEENGSVQCGIAQGFTEILRRQINCAKGKNPMKITEVLHCVFGFLPLKDIKICRLVSRQWNEVGETAVRKVSKISIGYPIRFSTFKKSLDDFRETFKFSGTQKQFSAFKLTTFIGNNAPWPETALEDFFLLWKNDLKELWIEGLHIEGQFPSFNMNNLLQGINLTRLDVKCDVMSVPRSLILQFSLNTIPNIKYLTLHECEIFLRKSIRISPIEITLKDCTFKFEEPQHVPKLFLSDFLDLKRLKSCKVLNGTDRNLCLDLNGNFQLDYLHLSGIFLDNWESSNWTINKFVFDSNSQFSGRTKIEVKDLNIKCTKLSSFAIPETVEKLSISETFYGANDGINFSDSIYLEHLEYLNVSSFKFRFTNFKACTELERVQIHEDANCDTIPVQTIPKSVKTLRIERTVEFVGKGTKPLSKLILWKYSLNKINQLLTILEPDNIVYYLNYSKKDNFENDAEALQFLKGPYKSIAIGPMDWSSQKNSFKTSLFSKLVNEKANYYIFTEKWGNALDETEFLKMMDL